MGVKDQFNKLKENWLIIVLVLVLLLVVSGSGNFFRVGTSSMGLSKSYEVNSMDALRGGGYYPSPSNFAPEEKNRVIIKTSSVVTQIDRGTYDVAAGKLKDIITSSGSITLMENVNKYGETGKEYRQGSYQLKVPVNKYDSVVNQLKAIGEVQNFVENAQDITGTVVDLKTDIATEEARLNRYNQMLKDATNVQDKLTLSDRIFDQERRVAYLKDQLSNTNERVDYASVTFNMNEKPSEYMNIAVAKFSELWRTLVSSLNALFYFAFAVLPWAVALGIIALIWKLFHRSA